MTREEAIKVLEMFLYKQCDLERTKFAYDELTVWDAVKMASEALAQSGTRKGKWIGGELGYCTCCGHEGCASDMWDRCDHPYCPNCGAEMEGVQT